MFNFSLFKFDADVDDNSHKLKTNLTYDVNNGSVSRVGAYRHQPLGALTAIVLAVSLLAGCQQQSQSESEAARTEEQIAQKSETVVQSDSAAAHIKQLQPIYVEQMQSLQRRLQAEYESLQAADMTSSDTDLLLNGANEGSGATNSNNANEAKTAISDSAPNPSESNSATAANNSAKGTLNNADNEANADIDSEADLQASTQVGERDLTVLRRISAEPRETTILTEKQIIDSYQQTIEALYQPISEPLDSEETDTLINIAALIPQLFEHTELADRLNAKSPALARLIVQHQIWEQIEARQASYMEEMKVAQQQEFESLMNKFNETIKGYDEQIAKYEQTLKEFE